MTLAEDVKFWEDKGLKKIHLFGPYRQTNKPVDFDKQQAMAQRLIIANKETRKTSIYDDF